MAVGMEAREGLRHTLVSVLYGRIEGNDSRLRMRIAPHCEFVVGIDEVGRGPLAGPLCVGACLVKRSERRGIEKVFAGVKDCKQLTERKRAAWHAQIERAAAAKIVTVKTTFIGQRTIDREGIRIAIRRSVSRLIRKLDVPTSTCHLLLDGGMSVPKTCPFYNVLIGGDEREPLIALASIAAKVRRDRRMIRLAKRYPQYGFDIHKGYGTKAHYAALKRYGPCELHRRSFLTKTVGWGALIKLRRH